MKKDIIALRVELELKESFKKICIEESTTISSKINDFIVNEVKSKKTKKIDGVLAETLKRFHGFSDEDIINEFKLITESDNVKIGSIAGYLVFYLDENVGGELKSKIIPIELKDLFITKFGNKNILKITSQEIDKFLKEKK